MSISKKLENLSFYDAINIESKRLKLIYSNQCREQSYIDRGMYSKQIIRFKEDITAMYLDKFRKKLDAIPELKILWPKTNSFLKSADVFNYRSLGNDFKAAFEEDLKNILSNLSIYIDSDSTRMAELKESKLYYPFNFSLNLSNQLVNGNHPVEILDYL